MVVASGSRALTYGDFIHSSFAGRRSDEELLRDIPGEIDPCGENGEIHAFVSMGPMFGSPPLHLA
jgi:diphthamide synthase (EF-2-diphthine--ammonia ligase)